MKILQIILTKRGGLIHYTSQLSNALSKNHEVYVIVPIGTDAKFFDNSINLIALNTGDIIKNFIINSINISRMRYFLKTIKKINPDIIHLQSYHPWMCLFLPFLKKYKIITTIHDVNSHSGSRIVDQQLSRYIHLKYSDALIVHGDNAKTILEKKAPRKKIYVIPHGDYTFFTKLTRNNFIEETGNILFFGRIADYKGIQYLIRAEHKISKSIPDTKIVIAGSGTFAEYDYVKGSPHFELHNDYIQDEDVGSFFQRASVVVLPYIECTQTGVIPIAYAFKKPVVVTNVGSIPEVVDEGVTGFIVPPGDSDALADAVIKLLKDEKLRKQMGRNAFMKMNNELSWDNIHEKTIEAYKTVLNSRK